MESDNNEEIVCGRDHHIGKKSHNNKIGRQNHIGVGREVSLLSDVCIPINRTIGQNDISHSKKS